MLLITLSSCKDKTTETPVSDYTLTFKATYNGQPLEKYKYYDYSDYKVRFSRFNTYISDVILLKGTEEVKLSDVEWVDFTPDDATNNLALEVPLQFQAPEGTYTGIKIGFGVRPDLNAKRPSDFPANHPLAKETEYWLGWKSYIFSKVEGQGDSNADGNDDIFLLYHCGSDAVYRSYTFNQPIVVAPGSGNSVEMDLKKLFTINNQWYDLRVPTNQYTSNNPADVTVATVLMDNLVNAVSVK